VTDTIANINLHNLMPMIQFEKVDVVFGNKIDKSLSLIDQGLGRDDIRQQTGQVVGVKQASLTVNQGEICVLMGLSGSGKSSLLRCVNGLNKVSRGKVLIRHGGEMIDFCTATADIQRELRTRRISMVFQKFALMPWLTVKDNVAFGLQLQNISQEEFERRVEEKLTLVGLEQWKDLKPSELSGGMQQRVGLARALATDSDILLMDEPFSALDPLIRQQLQDELLDLQAELGKTIIFVSHDLDEALKLGTRIVIMKDGEIIQQGKPEEIVLRPADEYVKNFVAHTNPLNVLQSISLMTPVSELKEQDGLLCIDEDKDLWLTPIRNGVPPHIVQRRSQGPSEAIPANIWIPAKTMMREAMETRYTSGYPLILTEDDEVVGIIRDQDFYHALLGKHTA
jgi:glycine betaine/proline transport system ATP-binding protein